jgi:hypothetical protein
MAVKWVDRPWVDNMMNRWMECVFFFRTFLLFVSDNAMCAFQIEGIHQPFTSQQK